MFVMPSDDSHRCIANVGFHILRYVLEDLELSIS